MGKKEGREKRMQHWKDIVAEREERGKCTGMEKNEKEKRLERE